MIIIDIFYFAIIKYIIMYFFYNIKKYCTLFIYIITATTNICIKKIKNINYY